jgi:hypothetical protein
VTVLWFTLGFAAAAAAWHAVAGHRWHLKIWRLLRPGGAVPGTAHDEWWHSLPRRHRAAVLAALLPAGAVAGLAYPLAPGPVTAILGLAGLAAAAGWALSALRARRQAR